MGSIQDIERQIAARIVADALAAGHCISVNDGEETTLRYSTDPAAIEAAMFTTDADVLFIYREDQNPVGWVQIIPPGNGFNAIAYHSDNKAMCDLLAGAEKLAEELEEAEARALRVGKTLVIGDVTIKVHGEIAPGLFICRKPDETACLHDGTSFRGYVERADGKRFRMRVWGPLGSAKRGDCQTGLYFTESGAERALMRIGVELHTKPAPDPVEELATQAAAELRQIELTAARGLQ